MTRPVDWAAEERKLQSVFDDIHEGRIKPAQAAVERWLKKHPKSQPALVARMMLVDATGQGRAAVLNAYDDVNTTAPLSPRSIWRVSTVLRSVRCPELVLEMFQALWDQHPDVPDLADQVFFEAAAVGNTEVMASSSRKTFNLQKFPARARLASYSAWAHSTPSPTDAELFPSAPERALLPAQLLIRTTGSDVPTSETLWLRLQVALGAGDVTESWRLVREEGRKGSLARRWFGMEAARAIAGRNDSAVPASSVWADEYESTSSLLRVDGDAQHNYAFYRHVLACVANAGDERVERAEKAAALFRDLVVAVGEKERSPLLALLELDKQEAEAGRGMPEDEWVETVKDYLDRWGGKWTAESEMAGIAGTHGVALCKIMQAAAGREHSDERSFVACGVAELYRIHHAEAAPASMEEAKRLWALYTAGLAYGKNLASTDPQPADPIGMAAVSVLARFWQANPEDSTPLTHAASALEYMVSRSPSSYPARFTLIRVYRLLGAPGLYAPHLKKLSLSEIQLDNLLHVISERGALEAHAAGIALWQDHADRATDMYGRSVTDLPNYIKQALQHETYSKVHGMRALIRALERSVAQRVLEVEELTLALSIGGALLESTIECLTAALRDNSPMVDNRNFELLADGFVGPAPAPTMSEATVRALGATILRAAVYIRGEAPPVLDYEAPSLSGVDETFVTTVDQILAAAIAASPSTAPTTTSPPPPEWSNLYDAPIAAVLSAKTTWERTDAYLALARLAGVARAIERRVTELAGPAKKGKKRPVGLVQLAVGLRGAREALPKRLTEIYAVVGKEIEFPAGGLVEDEDFTAELKGKVAEARKSLAVGVAKVINSSK